MKKAFILLGVFVLGLIAGAFAIGRLGTNLWQDLYGKSEATHLETNIVTASRLRSNKQELALKELDSEIAYGLAKMGGTHTKDPRAVDVWVLAKTYYEVNHLEVDPRIKAFLSTAPVLTPAELHAC